jgi:hypothetical protein
MCAKWNLKGRNYFGDICMEGRIIKLWNLEKLYVSVWTGLILGYYPVAKF